MVIDASCIKSLGRAHQLPLSSKKKGCTFVFLHENDSLSPQSVLIFPFCDPGAPANRGAVSGGGAAHALSGRGERPSTPEASLHDQMPKRLPKHLPLRRRIPVAHVSIRRPVRKRSYPVRFLGGIHLTLMWDICKVGVWILANDLTLIL